MEELQTEIGTEEATKLRAVPVVIQTIAVEEVGAKKSKKVVCSCLHPDADAPIKISQVKWENKGKLEATGLWYNLDDKSLIRKGSALASFLVANGAKKLSDLQNKSVSTVVDEKGYLCFKNY